MATRPLTGHESSILSFLSCVRDPKIYERFEDSLGEEAKLIALYVVGLLDNPADDVRKTGDYLLEYWEERKAREEREL